MKHATSQNRLGIKVYWGESRLTADPGGKDLPQQAAKKSHPKTSQLRATERPEKSHGKSEHSMA
jgi:hypothetical protein